MLSNATNQPISTVELGYMCPRGLLGPPAVTLTFQIRYQDGHLWFPISQTNTNLVKEVEKLLIDKFCTVKQSEMQNFSSICQSMQEKKAENCGFLMLF